jgi:UDP-N-acetylglucosamine 2-epimerase (non-hydrolysing)
MLDLDRFQGKTCRVANNLLRTDRPLILSIVGTRPEAIKMAPVVRALSERPAIRQELILTGQHKDIDEDFGLPKRGLHKLDINLKEQTAGEICEALHEALLRRISRRRPDLVLVQGDTTSALAGALAARDCGVPVGHVEAGLRSGDVQQPWPEEGNRIRIDALADLLFAPSETAALNLSAEPRVTGRVHITGNSGIDALLHARLSCPVRESDVRKTILVTCHRRENQGPELARIAAALKRLVRELPLQIVFPLHPNPHLRRAVKRLLGSEQHIALIDPVGHREMVCLIERCWLILTDSGGLQEEGPALGRPVLVLRNTTERTEAVESANVELVGTDSDRIFGAVAALLGDKDRYDSMSEPSFPFGDGHAAPRIARIVEDFLLGQPVALAAMPPIRN